MQKTNVLIKYTAVVTGCALAIPAWAQTSEEVSVYQSIAQEAMEATPNSFDLRESVPPYQFGNGLAGDDFWPFPGWRAHNGETGGFDTFMTVDPRDSVPGRNEVHFHDGTDTRVSDRPDTSQPGDRFFLGDHKSTFYTGRVGDAPDRDFVYIQFFEVGASKIYLHGKPENYSVVDVTTPYQGAAIFLKKGSPGPEDDDLMAVVLDVASRDILPASDHFEYATAPATVVQTTEGFDQLQTATVDVWPSLAVDLRGSIYMAVRTPSTLPDNANPDCGCDLAVVKYQADGTVAWQGNYGDGEWQRNGRFSRIYDSVFDNGYYYLGVFIGNAFGTGGGAFQIVKINATTGEQEGVFDYKPGPGVNNVTGIAHDNAGHLFLSGSSSSSVNEGPGPFFLKVAQDEISEGSNGLRVWEDGGLPNTFFHEGHGGVAFFPDGSGVRGKGTIANAGWNNMVAAGNHHAMWLRLWSDDGTLEDIIQLTNGDDFPGWAWQVEFDSQGFIYVTGVIHGQLADFPQEQYKGNADVVVFKIDPEIREVVAATLVGSEWSDEPIDMAIDAQDNLYITGHTYGSLYRTNPSPGRYADGFVIKMDHELNVLEGMQIGTPREDHFTSIEVQSGLVYVAGFTEGSLVEPIDTTQYNTDAVLLTLDDSDLSLTTENPVTSIDKSPQRSQEDTTAQNYPNPFSAQTNIVYQLSTASQVVVTVHNSTGREITRLVDERKPAGKHVVTWRAKGRYPGLYYYSIRTDQGTETGKMLLKP